MKDSLTHLSKPKQKELRQIADTIREHCPDAAMVILYGPCCGFKPLVLETLE